MAINVKVKVQTSFNKYISELARRNRKFTMQGARLLSKEIKEDIWRDQDTQTGKTRKRKFDVGGVLSDSDNLIVGSKTDENPNIETAKLVDSIRAGKTNPMSREAFVIADASNGSINYAEIINERNRFLQRGYYRQKAKLQELQKEIITQKNVEL